MRRFEMFDVVIAGSGVTGMSLAAALLARGLTSPDRIAVVTEALPSPPDPTSDIDLRVFALNRASQRFLTASGIWPLLPLERICAYERMRVWDASAAPSSASGTGSIGALSFDCAEIGEPDLGHIVEGRALHWEAFQAVRKFRIAVVAARISAASVDSQCAKLRLADGRELDSKLIIAADGAKSVIRTAFGIEGSGHAYHQTALVAHLRTERPHERTAWQRFLPTGPIALLPLADGRSSMVWSMGHIDAERVAALMNADDVSAAITHATGAVLGRCEATTPLARFPLEMQSADSYVRERLALIGDAAHTVHPLAGQGLNLGLADGAALMAILAGASHEEWGELRTLQRYERERRSENQLLATAFDGLDRIFSNADPVLTPLRKLGLSAVSRLPPLKRLLARRALGI